LVAATENVIGVGVNPSNVRSMANPAPMMALSRVARGEWAAPTLSLT